jgi:hypothetical protein
MKTKLIFENQYYSACTLDNDLIVQNKRSNKGIRILDNDAKDYINSIMTAIDDDERSFICKSLLN